MTFRFQVDTGARALPPDPMQEAARHFQAGDSEAAARCAQQALRQQPANFDALHLLGVLASRADRPAEAIDWLRRALAVRDDIAQAHTNLGNALAAAGRREEALASYDAALARQPDEVDALNNKGNVLRDLARLDAAEACFLAALAVRPSHAAAHYNLGRIEVARNNLDAAVGRFRAALAHTTPRDAPDRVADLWGELGRVLIGLDRVEEALETCRRLQAALPGHPIATWNESLALLLLGRYREAWPKYESRFAVPQHDPPRPGHRVLELDTVAGQRILLAAEQGRGDIIQFARYAPLLARRGAQVVVEAYPDLVPVLRTLDGVAEVVEFEVATPHDQLTSLLSLPLAFGTELHTIPAEVPYLRAPPDRLAAWRARLGPRARPRVGLVWRGWQHIPERSIPPQALRPLLDLPGIEFHALQKDLPDDQRAWLAAQPNLVDHGDALGDFADTAAAMMELDLIVSIDTAAAHLAGALGRPVWILLIRAADWRWLRHRTDSPWYPTARLFRRGAEPDWSAVIDAVACALPDTLRPAASA